MKNLSIYITLILSVIIVWPALAQTTTIQVTKPAQTSSTAQPDSTHNFVADSIARVDPKIVGGTIAPYGRYPEFTLIFEWREATQTAIAGYYLKCGGTLIAENKVLTAAHCVDDLVASKIFVVPNFYSVLPINPNTLPPIILTEVSGVDIHPRFSINTITNVLRYDVAVLTMKNKSDTPLALLYGGSELFADRKAAVIGMGAIGENSTVPVPTLREVVIPIVSNDVCSTAYADYGKFSITAEMICAGISKGGKGTCVGDSGGPLWTNHNGQRIQVGIVSFSRGCAQANGYGVYARISELIDFIREHASVITMIDAIPTPAISELLFDD